MLALAQRERDQLNLDLAFHVRRQQRRARRGQRGRCAWTRGWISRRKQFGVYHQLIIHYCSYSAPNCTNIVSSLMIAFIIM
jgi:hypothetical protein